jgi:hypothetical protein
MFQVFDLDVAKVYLRHCICFSDNIRMLKAYVFKCFRCFRCMFQVFYLDVAKVDLGVAYTCIYVHVAKVCFMCFIRMLQVFNLDVACV